MATGRLPVHGLNTLTSYIRTAWPMQPPPKCVQPFHKGSQIENAHFLLLYGTRTRVTAHFGKPELVVFCPFALKLLPDAVLHLQTRSPRRHLASPGSTLGCRFSRLFGLGRLLFESAPRSHGKLLLRLLASQNLCGLRENVRIAEIRFAVVGRDLQETSLQRSRRDARCWPARTSSRTFRARFQQVTCSAG